MDKPRRVERRKDPRVRAEALVLVRRVEGETQLARGAPVSSTSAKGGGRKHINF